PFVIAALGVRTRSGATRKVDHDRVNEVLNRAYGPVVHAVARRYDDRVRLTNSDATPLDDIGGLELTRIWREEGWRNAERLVIGMPVRWALCHRRRISGRARRCSRLRRL